MSVKYADYHRLTGAFADLDAFDRALTAVAVRHPWIARVADSYAVRFARGSALRKKLALMVAILECSPGFFERIDTVHSGPRLLILARMAVALAASAISLAVSLVLFGPLHLFHSRRRN